MRNTDSSRLCGYVKAVHTPCMHLNCTIFKIFLTQREGGLLAFKNENMCITRTWQICTSIWSHYATVLSMCSLTKIMCYLFTTRDWQNTKIWQQWQMQMEVNGRFLNPNTVHPRDTIWVCKFVHQYTVYCMSCKPFLSFRTCFINGTFVHCRSITSVGNCL